MSRFVNKSSGVQFSVDDRKDDRFGPGYEVVKDKAPAKRSASPKKSD